MNSKNFILEILKNNKLTVGILFCYSYFAGYYIANWVTLISTTEMNFFYIFLILFANFSFKYIKELLIMPIYNHSIMLLKKNYLKKLKNTEISSAKIMTQFQKSASLKITFQHFFELLKDSISILVFIKYIISFDKKFALYFNSFLIIYFYIIFLAQKKSIQLRKISWRKTELNYEDSLNLSIQQNAIRQNFFSISEETNTSFFEEYEAWNKFYIFSNFYYLFLCVLLSAISIIGFMFERVFLIYSFAIILEKFTHRIKIFTNSIYDLKDFFQETESFYNKSYIGSQLVLEDVNINFKNIKNGPISFKMNENIISIQGQNGIGKTMLALAIANLIKFDGKIFKPSSIYIDLKNFPIKNKNLSQGEKIIKIIENAITKKYKLLIFDEVLDVLSLKNIEMVFKLIKSNKKQAIIITHNENVAKFAETRYELLHNLELKTI